MITELQAAQFANARDLFAPLAWHLSSRAALEGENWGRVWVDDPADPQTGFMMGVEATYLAGRADDPAVLSALGEVVAQLRAEEADARENAAAFYAVCAPEADWLPVLAQVFPDRPPQALARRHYLCTTLQHDWRAHLPDDFGVYRVDADLLARPGLDIPDHLRGWMPGNWGSVENFLANGLGFCTVDEAANRVASWSMADCRADVGGPESTIEIGIQTRPAYRRRGLAAITAAAAVEYAFANGYHAVGWHCNEDNLGSRGTAERVGFTLARRYTMYYTLFDEGHHLANMGWVAFRAGRHAESAALYARVFALWPDARDYMFFLAARVTAMTGDLDRALYYLDRAVTQGWDDADDLRACAEFAPLHDDPAWGELLRRIAE